MRGNTTSYAYDADTTTDHTLGDLQSVTSAAGQVTQYTRYDKTARNLQSIDPDAAINDTHSHVMICSRSPG